MGRAMSYKTKTKEQIISQTSEAFKASELGGWDVDASDKDCLVIYMDEEGDGYNASAFGLATKDGELYEFEDRHCSCDGYYFSPVPCNLPALAMRVLNGGHYGPIDRKSLAEFIGAEAP